MQDYALTLEQDKQTLTSNLATKDTELKELQDTNLLLQKRNNELFVRVEQGVKSPQENEQEDDQPVESCEDFALKNIKEILK